MTNEEQEAYIKSAADISYDPEDIARALCTPLFAKIAALEAENAALRQRLVVDDAMVKRAEIAYANEFHRTIRRESSSYRCMRAALTAALANKDDPT